MPAINTCAVLGKFAHPGVAETARALVRFLLAREITVLVEATASHELLEAEVEPVADGELVARAQLAIVIGGDGSLLYAARLIAGGGVPVLGINRGRLGFLTDTMPDDMIPCVEAALAGECVADHRPLLQARLVARDGSVREQLALNDVVLSKWETGRILDFETRIDGQFVNTHGGDGLVVASATGSTAYALSCGGPIIEPHLDVLVVVPICPHTLSDRPIVVSRSSNVVIRLLERADTRAQVTCDGAVLGELLCDERLEIAPSDAHITLLHPPGYEYYRLLRSKLHWGRSGYEKHER